MHKTFVLHNTPLNKELHNPITLEHGDITSNKMAPVVELFHIPKFRSTRVLWLYYELEAIYGVSRSDFPKLKLNKLSPETFRNALKTQLISDYGIFWTKVVWQVCGC